MKIKFSSLALVVLAGLFVATGVSYAEVNTQGYIQAANTSPSISSYSGSVRFVWDPTRRHFQAGILNSNTPGNFGFTTFAFGQDIQTSGTFSLGIGSSNVASGTGSMALGISNNSTGNYTMALGSGNSANGHSSGAFGRNSSVNVGSGSTAFALGNGLTVRHANAFVVGRFNDRASTTSGTFRFVVGDGTSDTNRSDAFWIDANGNVYAKGNFFANNGSVQLGSGGGSLYTSGNMTIGTTNSAYVRFNTNGSERMRITSDGNVGIGTTNPHSSARLHVNGGMVVGDSNSLGSSTSFAAGSFNSVPGSSSVALGQGNTAGGLATVAIGGGVTTGGQGSFAAGSSSHSTGSSSIAMGSSNVSSGFSTIALGSSNEASGNASIAIGRQTKAEVASNATAVAIGYGVEAFQANAVVVGRFNDKGRSSNDGMAFVVGTGTGSGGTPRRDGLRLDNNGNLWVASGISGGTSGNALVLNGQVRLAQPQGDIPMGVFQ